MTSRDFVYWLQGHFEFNPDLKTLNEHQVAILRAHLNLVFKHEIDPSFGDEAKQAELNNIHKQPFDLHPHHDGVDKTLIRC